MIVKMMMMMIIIMITCRALETFESCARAAAEGCRALEYQLDYMIRLMRAPFAWRC